MSKRYIDVDKLAEMIRAKGDTMLDGKQIFLYIAKWLEFLPPADVVEVVKCADCKYYHPYETPIEGFDGCCNVHEIECNKDFYCQYGQRRKE